VKAILNVNDLRPTASRESFYEDATLLATRSVIGECIRNYLLNLAQTDPPRLEKLINLHFLAIKSLAVHDDEFYRIFIDLLPFETSLGRMTLGEYKQENSVILYVSTLAQFRQIAQVASAQNISVINGGYVYDYELLAKHSYIFPQIPTEEIDATTLTYNLEDLTLTEREQIFNLIKIADLVYNPINVQQKSKNFSLKNCQHYIF
jgi:molecular chaperone HtpG